MKTMKNILKSSTLAKLSALFAIAFVANVFSMRMTPEQMKRAKGATKRTMEELKQQKNSYFIYDKDNPENGIWVDKKLAKENSKTIKFMAEYLEEETNKIALPCSINIIKLGFDLLDNKVDIRKLSLGQLVDVANLFNFLEVPADKMKAVLVEIKESIDKSGAKNINEELNKLPPELQTFALVERSINCLKDCIIKKYANDRSKSLAGHPRSVDSVAFSHDGTKIVSGCWSNYNNIILWDISDPHNIVAQTLDGHPNDVNSVAFSRDGTKIVSGCSGNQNNLILWDISDLQNIVHQPLVGNPSSVNSVAFSSDGTKIVSGCFGDQNNLILWDISNPDNIVHQTLVGHPTAVSAVAFSHGHDGTKIVSGCYGSHNNLILWDISNPQNIVHQTLVGHMVSVNAVAFSSDGTKIVSGCDLDRNNLILWDISNPHNIVHQALVGHPKSVRSVAFSPDSTNIVSGCSGEQDNLILWDISNPQNITHQTVVGHQEGSVGSIAFNHDGTKIAFGCAYRNNLIILTLLTDQENTLLKQLENYTTDQILLIYQLCLQSLKGQVKKLKKDSEEYAIFMTLPHDMQQLLTDLFIPKGWFSGWL